MRSPLIVAVAALQSKAPAASVTAPRFRQLAILLRIRAGRGRSLYYYAQNENVTNRSIDSRLNNGKKFVPRAWCLLRCQVFFWRTILILNFDDRQVYTFQSCPALFARTHTQTHNIISVLIVDRSNRWRWREREKAPHKLI